MFQRDRSVIGKHVRNIFKEGELFKELAFTGKRHPTHYIYQEQSWCIFILLLNTENLPPAAFLHTFDEMDGSQQKLK